MDGFLIGGASLDAASFRPIAGVGIAASRRVALTEPAAGT